MQPLAISRSVLQHQWQIIIDALDLRLTTKELLKQCSYLQAPISGTVTIGMQSPVLAGITRSRLPEIEPQLIPHLSELFRQRITKVYIL